MSAKSVSPTSDTDVINVMVKNDKGATLFKHATLHSGVNPLLSPGALTKAKTICLECREDETSGAYEVTVTIEERDPDHDFRIGVALGKERPHLINAPISHRVALKGTGPATSLQADVESGTLILRAL